tara:strand:+ start:598 stop:1176 length:579 start_codon:yes stop_codon:yes gene_type:complete
MSTLKKNGFFYSVCFLVALIGLFVFSSLTIADDAAVPEIRTEQNIIKIPPPIEGLKLPDPEQAQELETANIKIFTSNKQRYVFHVQLAKTKEQQHKGLMYKKTVDPMTGMLFLFDESRERTFWMKNTWAALDIIFIRNDGVIHSIHPNAQPKSLERIKSNGSVNTVLEIAGGEAKRLGITVGDLVVQNPSLD